MTRLLFYSVCFAFLFVGLSTGSNRPRPAAFAFHRPLRKSSRCILAAGEGDTVRASEPVHTRQIGIYIHIPYCRRRCRYCNFAIVPIGPRAPTDKEETDTTKAFLEMDRNYTDAILREMDLVPRIITTENVSIASIYFGGGTPSLAPVGTITRIMRTIQKRFQVQPDAEITIEMDPGTFSCQQAKALNDLGFNRISLGVQSFEDRILESLGRVHRRRDIDDALSILKSVFGSNVNYSIDLISGLPGQSPAQWISTLETATKLNPRPTHLSLYDLQVESGTVFSKWYDTGEPTTPSSFQQTRGEAPVGVLPLPSDEDSSFMYSFAAGYLRSKGFEHYEVSSYARLPETNDKKPSPWRSQHNQIYWAVDGEWYAFGLGSTSFIDGVLTARPRALADYIDWVKDRATTSGAKLEPVTADIDVLMDTVLKRLRTSEGLQLDWIRRRFPQDGERYAKAVVKGAQLGVELGLAQLEEESGVLRLKNPRGFLYSNSIISAIFAEFEAW